MKMKKRCLALLFAMVMMVSTCFGNGMTIAFATETADGVSAENSADDTEKTSNESAEAEKELNMDAIATVVDLFEKLPAASDLEELSEEEVEEVMQQTTDAINAYDALTINECEYIIDSYPELYSAVMEDLSSALLEMQQSGTGTMSLLPLEEVEAYLVLNEQTEEGLKSFSVDEMLTKLVDKDGNSITVLPSDATTVWRYVKDTTTNVETYEEYPIGMGATIDLSAEQDIHNYRLELIVGSGSQLNRDNIRYIIKVYVSNTVQEELDYVLYSQNSMGVREEVVPERKVSALNTQTYDITVNSYIVPEPLSGSQYYLGIFSAASEHPDVRVEVYDFFDFIVSNTNAIPITDQVLNPNMQQAGEGVSIEYGATNMFAIAYFDDGKMMGLSFVSFSAVADASYIQAGLYCKDGDELVDVVMLDADHIGFEDVDSVFAGDGIHELGLMLKEGYSTDSDLYCVLEAHGTEYGDDANRYVVKAVEGHYDSLDAASECVDIKEQLIPADKLSSSRGYKANYDYEVGGAPFTIFFEDGSVWKILVLAMEYDSKYDPDYMKEYTDVPIIGEADPWFRVTGANDSNGDAYDTYVIENGKNINIDTMYGYGYQTIFINEDVDSFVPTFWKANDEAVSIDRIYANGSAFEEGSELSFPEGENTLDATFSVIITDQNGSHPKNYDVTFVKKASGPQLYVAGPLEPDVRSVFLDEYHEKKHDIFIANVGDEPLTDLWLDLDATNVELDDYWTIGGEGNDTLEACPENFSAELASTDYGELSNVAKIRLVPPATGKEGEIEGTLKIYSGEEGNTEDSELLATIVLSGLAQNPEIITEETDDAVKYVPYSYLVTTNNMYDWVDVSYALTEGTLPDGVELIPETGEIYGVPQETGTFTFTVSAQFESTSENYDFAASSVGLTLTVNDNTDANVYNATDADDNYSILDAIGVEETTGDHHYILEESGDQVFRSEGEMGQFVDVWLNGQKLVRDEDYTVDEGSTRITIKEQTFAGDKTNKDGERNTIAAEFRTSDPENKNDANNSNELRRTSQNFYIAHTHSYDGGKITTTPTCTTAGVRTYTCTSCGYQYTEAVPALGHASGEAQVTKQVTCTENGEISYYCIRCNVLMKTEVIVATGHDYKVTITPGKDCVTDGVRTSTCRKCGDTYTEPIKAQGHKYVSEVTIEPTETEEGLRTYTCTVCNDTFTEVIPALGDGTHIHTYDEGVISKEATCLENGMMIYTCTQCGAVKEETILATGHKFVEEIVTEATCTEAGEKKMTCEKCGDSYTERILAKGHSYDSGVVTKEPTDNDTGIKTYTCTVCGSSYTEVIPMLNSNLGTGGGSGTGGSGSGAGAVETGDDTAGTPWWALMLVSVSVIAATVYLRKRRNYK